jgi:prephenate dehydratase
MDIVIGIASLIVAVIGVYFAYLQLRHTPEYKRGDRQSQEPKVHTPSQGSSETDEKKRNPPNIKSLIENLIHPKLQTMFRYEEFAAYTNDDEAGLALIAALIEKRAAHTIQVIGRGPQVADQRIEDYLRAIATAIARGVQYRRILFIDPNLPQNALLWLLFLERYLHSDRYRGMVLVHTIRIPAISDMLPQFQIIDGMYLHRVNRHYAGIEAGASRIAQSLFAMHPHPELQQHINIYQTHLENAGNRCNHSVIVQTLNEILYGLDHDGNVTSHWKTVVDIKSFLDARSEFPQSGLKFVGTLPPFTYTYDACKKFIEQRNEESQGQPDRKQVLPLVFNSLETAADAFLKGELDYLCVPIENSALGDVIPPAIKPAQLALINEKCNMIHTVNLQVKFVLAGVSVKPGNWLEIAAVEAAYLQTSQYLPKQAQRLARHKSEVRSNYHAALLARNNSSLVAITTPEAAEHLNLVILSELPAGFGDRSTKFAIFEHKFQNSPPLHRKADAEEHRAIRQ